MSLMVTYPPHQDESGLGYYRRLASDNLLLGWEELAKIADVRSSRGALLTQVEQIARQLGLEPEWALQALQQESNSRTWGKLLRIKADAVCPDCLAEAAYLRQNWAHAYVTACPIHQIQLVDRCNNCGESLSPNREHISRCACGHAMESLPRQSATSGQLWLSHLISSLGTQTGGIEPSICGVDVATVSRVVATLCLSADPNKPMFPRSAAFPLSISAAVDFLAPLDALLADWPHAFRDHIENRIAVGKPEARTLNTLLGEWYITLRKLTQGNGFEPLLQVVIDAAAEKFDGLLGLDSAKALAEVATEHLRAPDAAKKIGIGVDRLHKAIRLGECASRARLTGTRGQIYEIPYDEVARIQEQRSRWVSREAACELAGVSPSVLERMMAAGVVNSDVNWRHDLLKGGPVESASIQALVDRISAVAEPASIREEETLAWSGLTSRRMGDKRAIQTVMQAIADGKVKAIATGQRLGEMVFRRSEVIEYFGTPLLEAGMSLNQLSKVTGWKWESISHWIAEGLLHAESVVVQGRLYRVVFPQELLRFRQTYVPLADLARGIGTKSSALLKLLPGIELVGARQLPDGAKRGGLVKIMDLCRLAMLGARAGQDLFVPSAPL